MENGLFSGVKRRPELADPTTSYRFTTAMIEGGSNQWAILGGNAQSGSLSTDYSGVRPSGYNPMKKQGAIILGIGGDNSKSSAGTFYEGVMTSGYPSAAPRPPCRPTSSRPVTPPPPVARPARPARSWPGVNSSDCVDNNNASGTPGNKVQIWACDGNTGAQNWTVNSNGTLTIDGGCMDITGAKYSTAP